MMTLSNIIFKISIMASTAWFFVIIWNKWLSNFCQALANQSTSEVQDLKKKFLIAQKSTAASEKAFNEGRVVAKECLEKKIRTWTDSINRDCQAQEQFFKKNHEEWQSKLNKKSYSYKKEQAELSIWLAAKEIIKNRLLSHNRNENQSERMPNHFWQKNNKSWAAERPGLAKISRAIANVWSNDPCKEALASEASIFVEFLNRNPGLIVRLEATQGTGENRGHLDRILETLSINLKKTVSFLLNRKQGPFISSILKKALVLAKVGQSLELLFFITAKQVPQEEASSMTKLIENKVGQRVKFIVSPELLDGFILRGQDIFVDHSCWSKMQQSRSSFAYFKEFLPNKDQ